MRKRCRNLMRDPHGQGQIAAEPDPASQDPAQRLSVCLGMI
jgi:hypothetical protein